MASSPVAILFSTDGVEVGVKDGLSLPANARGFIGVGVDGGGNTQFILVDTSGRQQIVGAAAEGAATAGNPVLVAGTDGTNARTPFLFDADTGAGTQYVLGVVLRKSASGGSVELGTSSDPVRTDPTGATTQPVSGTVSATQGTAAAATAPWAVRLSDGSSFYSAPTGSQLPASLVGGRLDVNTGAWLGSTAPTVGQKTMANSLPVVIASNQTTVPVGTYGSGDSFTGGKGVVVGGVDPSATFKPLNADSFGNIGTWPGGTWQASLHSSTVLTANGFYDSWVLPTRDVSFTVDVESVSGTNPVLTFFFKEQGFGSGDYEEKVWTLGPITAVGKYRVELVGQVGAYIDVLWTVSGSSPSFTCTSGFLANAGGPSRIGADNDKRTVHHDSTVTANGARSFGGLGSRDMVLVINVKANPTGTTPTLTYTVSEVDPGDQTTVIGTPVSSTAINAINSQVVSLSNSKTGAVKVSWALTGGSPSFTGVYAALVSRHGSPPSTGGGSSAATTGTSSNVSASTTVVTVLASNSSRLGAHIFNDGNGTMYVKLGSSASTTSYTTKIWGQEGWTIPNYTGIITAVWSSANGSARVTELT